MSSTDRQHFRNEDLTLKVSTAVDRRIWEESRYEAFLEELCGEREYQKEAIRVSLRYMLGGQHQNLSDLAKANFQTNPYLLERYGSWEGMVRHLQFPSQLAASLDLATGTGKSYVLFGVAVILLAEGLVDRALVLCPSTTIERGLMDKFRELSSNADLLGLLPAEAKVSIPRIISANETVSSGSICIENYHAILDHVGSSIQDSFKGSGHSTVVLNDETHHVANESDARVKKWKEFLSNPEYGFKYIIGVSGTCYIGNDYFADVIYRYSLKQAIEENYVKRIDYIAEMPHGNDPDEKWQLIRNRHEDIKRKLQKHKILPLTIVVTPSIARCQDVSDGLKAFLMETDKLTPDIVNERVLVVYNNAPGLNKLPFVDSTSSKVEWIVSVSMLTEGWDVKRVFQIVPHEERAFNSKLLIAQVLGRGLRVPNTWAGTPPAVTVFNHDAWATRIRHLVNEILEIEKKLSCHVMDDSPHHFDLVNIDYSLEASSTKKPMDREYKLFEKGFIDLAAHGANEDVSIEFERAAGGEPYKWQTKILHKTYTAREIAVEMYNRLEEAQDPDDPDINMRTVYTEKFPIDDLEKIVKRSLEKLNLTVATDRMKQKFFQSLGTLRRKSSEFVRYTPIPDQYYTVSTQKRQSNSVSATELRRDKCIFVTELTRSSLVDEQVEFFDEVFEEGSLFRRVKVLNRYDFTTPLNAVIADSDPERRFINMLIDPQNVSHYNSWIKSTSTRFYEIDYAWKKGEHPKRGKFNPDFFVRIGNLICVIEIKGDEELREPSDENRKKNEYAINHFNRINEYLRQQGEESFYKFTFLTERNFTTFFQYLRENKLKDFRSELDVALSEGD